MTGEQAKKLAALKRLLVVAFDSDKAGMRATRMVREKLSRIGVLTSEAWIAAKFKDLGDMPIEEVRRLLRPSAAA